MTEIYRSSEGQAAVESLYRRALARWPGPHQHLRVPTREGETFVIAAGEPSLPPLVLIHGSGTNSAMWMRDIPDLTRVCRVYAVDLIGEPGLSAASRPALASDAHAAWLDEVWDGLGLAAAHVAGVSLGGWMALDYAIRRPQRVATLSLISPAGIGRQNHAFIIRTVALSLLGSWGRRRAFARMAGGKPPDEVMNFIAAIFKHFRPRLERLPMRTERELGALTMPVQLIVGGRDALLRSSETRDRIARHVKGARITYLEDGGHVLPPQGRAISAFISACASPQATRPAPEA